MLLLFTQATFKMPQPAVQSRFHFDSTFQGKPEYNLVKVAWVARYCTFFLLDEHDPPGAGFIANTSPLSLVDEWSASVGGAGPCIVPSYACTATSATSYT